MALTFGAQLRERREEQQIPLAAIAERTKINISLLEGLERDDVSRWPGGIFRRSYFRSYAQAIGVDADAMLRRFLELHPEPDEEVTTVLAKARLGETGARRPPTRLRFLIDSAVNALPALQRQSGLRFRADTERPPAPASSTRSPQDHHQVRPPDFFDAAATEPVREPEPPGVTERFDPMMPESTDSAGRAAESADVHFDAVARLCTRLGCAVDVRDVSSVLEGAGSLLDAIGVIVWVRDALGIGLTPVLAQGYPDDMVARLPYVSRDADNAIALAFRSAETRIVDATEGATGAVVVPMLAPAGCAGVLAIELRPGDEQRHAVRVSAALLAAQLSTLLPAPVLADVVGV